MYTQRTFLVPCHSRLTNSAGVGGLAIGWMSFSVCEEGKTRGERAQEGEGGVKVR